MNAVVFPGHGAQYKGMGKDIYDAFPKARETFSYIDSLLGINISQKCFFAEKEELYGLYIQQLAILATSLATYEVFKGLGIKIDFFSGLSLGEYICLYPAGVLTLEDIVYLVKKRAEATQEAAKKIPSAMLAVMGVEKSRLEILSREGSFYIANINSPQQTVVAVKEGDRERIKRFLEREGANIVEVNSGGGFHSPLMAPATSSLRRYAEGIEFNNSKVPVVSNLTARSLRDKEAIKKNIVEQLSRTIFWKDCVEFMAAEGVDTFFEVGPSRVLLGLIKDTMPQAKVVNVERAKDLDKLS